MSQSIGYLLPLCLLFCISCSRLSVAIPVIETAASILSGQCVANLQDQEALSEDITSILREKVLPALGCPALGSCANNPAASCKQISQERPDAPSGDYWIRVCDGSAVRVFCDMGSRCCNSTSGWMRAAYLNMTDPAQKCPAGLYLGPYAKRLCKRRQGYACKSIFFPMYHLPYTRVCGRVIAYQEGTVDAFWQYFENRDITLEDDYLDGVSITVGYPRTHVWSFAASNTEGGPGADSRYSCPCARTDIPTESIVPPFIGSDYFCESGAANQWGAENTVYLDDPLWDGENCPDNSACCQLNNPPWFCKDLGSEFRNDIEVRLCGDEHLGNEETPLELIELYVQ